MLNNNIGLLKLPVNIEKKLLENDICYVEDLQTLNRGDLKDLEFSNEEINTIVIKLQLEGLDLNKRKSRGI